MKKILREFFDLYISDNKLLFSIFVRIYYYSGYFFYLFNIFLKKPYLGSYLFSDQESGRERQKIILNKIVKKINKKKIKILELGVYCGQTTINITNAIKEKKFEYTCVDIWKGFKISDKNNNFQYKQIIYDLNSGRVYKLFLHNIKCIKNNFTGRGRIIIKKTSCQSFFKNNKKKFDLIIIDASHKFRNVYEDIKSVKKILNNLGFIIGDDYELEAKNFTFQELKKIKNTDLILSKKFNKTFHPGITLAIKYLFKNLKNNKGLFCVRKVGNRYYDYFKSKYRKIPTSF